MTDDMRANPKLAEEYENTFDSEEKIANAIKMSQDEFTIDTGVVSFDDLIIPDSVKKGRKESHLGLSTSVAEMGILQPIHVMITEGYSDYVEENGYAEGYEGYKYVLLDGFRRVYAGYKNGLTRANAVIWDFKDKDKGADFALTLTRILNKNQKNTWAEIWYLYQTLELQSALTPGTLEYLLQLNPGDAMKLKDIMSCDYPEIKETLLSNKKTLDQVYSMLQKERREENQTEKEDRTGVSDMDVAEDIVDKPKADAKLSNDEIKQILEMEDEFDGDLSDDDFDELMGSNIDDYGQKVGERHPLDPELRAAVLQRDGYKCVISGRGEGLPANIALSILNVHHKIPVHCGGKDTMDNLITVELSAHTLIHVIERNNGKLGMSKEEFDALPESEQIFIKGVMKVARIAVEANRKMGTTREEIREATKENMKFRMPGEVQKENMEAIAKANMKK